MLMTINFILSCRKWTMPHVGSSRLGLPRGWEACRTS